MAFALGAAPLFFFAEALLQEEKHALSTNNSKLTAWQKARLRKGAGTARADSPGADGTRQRSEQAFGALITGRVDRTERRAVIHRAVPEIVTEEEIRQRAVLCYKRHSRGADELDQLRGVTAAGCG